jgi:hypothetical protein
MKTRNRLLLSYFITGIFLSSTVVNGAINKYWHVASDGSGTSAQGTTWAQAIGVDTLIKVLNNSVTAGDVFFIKEGNYTLSAAINSSARDGTATSPIAFIGVKAATTNEGSAVTYTDFAIDSVDRNDVFIDAVTYQWRIGDYYITKNLYIQGSVASTYQTDLGNIIENCKFENDHDAVAGRFVLNTYQSIIIDCEFLSANNGGITIQARGTRIVNCKFNNMLHGTAASVLQEGTVLLNNVFKSCSTAINAGSSKEQLFANNTFFGCKKDILYTTGHSNAIFNNIHDSSKTSGIKFDTQTDNNYFSNNHGNNARCTDMWIGVDTATIFQDYRVTTGDPKFINPAADSLQLGSGSPCINTGIGVK